MSIEFPVLISLEMGERYCATVVIEDSKHLQEVVRGNKYRVTMNRNIIKYSYPG